MSFNRDDLYSGFLKNPGTFPNEQIPFYGTQIRVDTSSNDQRLLTRPSTAIRPVGYTSDAGKLFDNLQQAQKRTIVIENRKDDA